MPIALRGQDGGPDDVFTRQLVDLGLRLGETMLATGASAADVSSTVLRVTNAYDVKSVHVDVTLSSITISHHRGIYRDPITVMRIVAIGGQDFTRLGRAQQLVRDAEGGDLPIEEARARLDEITHAPQVYSRLIVSLASMVLGAAVSAVLYGGWTIMLLSALTTGLVEQTVRRLARFGIPGFFRQVVGGAIPTVVAIAVTGIAQRWDIEVLQQLRPSLMVASGVVVLLAGLAAVGAAQDTLDGYYVTASGRTFEVLLLSGGVVTGVLGVLAIAQHLGISMSIRTDIAWNTRPSGIIASGIIALAAAVQAYSGPRTVACAAGIGALAWTVYGLTTGWGLSAQFGTAIAALAVGLVATAIGMRTRIPSLALATAGIVPLLPGMTIYQAVFRLVDHNTGAGAGMSTLLGAVFVGLAIASGVTLGSLPGRRRAHRVLFRKRVAPTDA